MEVYLHECKAIHGVQEESGWPALSGLNEEFCSLLLRFAERRNIPRAVLFEANLARHLSTIYGYANLSWPTTSDLVVWSDFESFVQAHLNTRREQVINVSQILPSNNFAKRAEKLVIKSWKKAGFRLEKPGSGVCYSWPREARTGFLHWVSSRNGRVESRSTLHLAQERTPTICESLGSLLGVGAGFAKIRVRNESEILPAVERILWWFGRFESVVDSWSVEHGIA